MCEYQKKPEPKKIKMSSLVDRSSEYDTLSFDEDTLQEPKILYENNKQNNSQSVSELESMQGN